MNEKKAKEILTAATGDEGSMIHCFEANAYSGEIPQGNEAKRIELVRLALACLDECQTCGGSRKGIGGSGYENEKGEYVETETIPCPDCQPKPDAECITICEKCNKPIWSDHIRNQGLNCKFCMDCQPKPEPCRGLVEQIERILSTYFDSVPLDEIRLLLSRLRSPTPKSPSTSSRQASESVKSDKPYYSPFHKSIKTELRKEAANKKEDDRQASELVKELRKLCYGYEDGWDAKGELVVPAPLAVCAHKLGEAADRIERLESENKLLQRGNELFLEGHLVDCKHIEQLQAELKAKDEILFAYETVRRPINPLIAEIKQLEQAFHDVVQFKDAVVRRNIELEAEIRRLNENKS